MTRARVPRSLAGDSAVAAGGQGLLDVPGHAFGPSPHPWINTMMAARRALSTQMAWLEIFVAHALLERLSDPKATPSTCLRIHRDQRLHMPGRRTLRAAGRSSLRTAP